MLEDIQAYFANKTSYKFHEETDKGHGRVELRQCWSTSDIQWLRDMHPDWKDLTSICMINSERLIKGKTEQQQRYYISSTQGDMSSKLCLGA